MTTEDRSKPHENDEPRETKPQAKQEISFEITPQMLQAIPGLQIPVQNQATDNTAPSSQPPKQLEAVVRLIESGKEVGEQGNSAESQVASQIILISSAILGAIGVLSLNNSGKIPWPEGVLLLLAVVGLGTSLIAGVSHFMSERKFWYNNREKIVSALNIVSAIASPADRNNAAAQASNQLIEKSSEGAFWVQIVSFAIGILALIILAISTIVIKLY
jgi:hypothetical protein